MRCEECRHFVVPKSWLGRQLIAGSQAGLCEHPNIRIPLSYKWDRKSEVSATWVGCPTHEPRN